MKIGDRIKRVSPKGDTVTRENKNQEELEYQKSLESEGFKFTVFPEISGGTCVSCEG